MRSGRMLMLLLLLLLLLQLLLLVLVLIMIWRRRNKKRRLHAMAVHVSCVFEANMIPGHSDVSCPISFLSLYSAVESCFLYWRQTSFFYSFHEHFICFSVFIVLDLSVIMHTCIPRLSLEIYEHSYIMEETLTSTSIGKDLHFCKLQMFNFWGYVIHLCIWN
jgi:hypothetical protein